MWNLKSTKHDFPVIFNALKLQIINNSEILITEYIGKQEGKGTLEIEAFSETYP